MAIKPGVKDALWMAAGAAMLLVVTLLVLRFQKAESAVAELALRSRKIDLVERARLAVASASEAEKSAVLAITDDDSKTYADQARAATGEAERARAELQELLETRGTLRERDLLGEFSRCFTDLRRIDGELLDLAVKNTNLKAYALAFGPAAEAIAEMDAAISQLVRQSAALPEARNVILLALGAEAGALRIQALLPPHIAEESDEKMDALEARMSEEDQGVRRKLDGLAAFPKLKGDHALETAISAYARFNDLKKQILVLSRENTNVRSLSISLNQKRKVSLLCQDALAALQREVEQESTGASSEAPVSPR